ncbi:MAG: hypothetical protein ACLR5S_05365 [Ruminococcus sp.]
MPGSTRTVRTTAMLRYAEDKQETTGIRQSRGTTAMGQPHATYMMENNVPGGIPYPAEKLHRR